ncbi:hypothetical protein ACE38V_10275 [Cytobacillus sp. Hz8]|uniref:hypothetical protein n=1 Tax=Cytobacillus sp. Hz8 TaxID=3347168 RepID=UPI0035DA3807
MFAVSLILMAIGIFITMIGYSIYHKGKTSFIAGFNEVFIPKNEKKLARQIGCVIIIFGIETFLFPIAYQIIDGLVGFHLTILSFLHILVVLLFMLSDQLSQG